MKETNNYLMRSLMFVPGHNDRLLKSASRSDADVILFDLEDSVQPVENKKIAREKIKEMIAAGAFNKHVVFARINDRESGQLLKDLYSLTIEGVHGFMYPKSTEAGDVYFIDKLLETIEYEKNIPIGTLKLIPLIETAAAVLNAQEIIKASNRVVAIAFGCEDFITDLRGIHDSEGISIYNPRALIAMAARANGVIPVDTVHIKVHDLEDLEKNLTLSKKLGYEGMLVLHPKEINIVHRYYSPTEEDLNEAKDILKLSEEAESQNKGVAIMNGKFIGPPMVASAKLLLMKDELIKSKKN